MCTPPLRHVYGVARAAESHKERRNRARRFGVALDAEAATCMCAAAATGVLAAATACLGAARVDPLSGTSAKDAPRPHAGLADTSAPVAGSSSAAVHWDVIERALCSDYDGFDVA